MADCQNKAHPRLWHWWRWVRWHQWWWLRWREWCHRGGDNVDMDPRLGGFVQRTSSHAASLQESRVNLVALPSPFSQIRPHQTTSDGTRQQNPKNYSDAETRALSLSIRLPRSGYWLKLGWETDGTSFIFLAWSWDIIFYFSFSLRNRRLIDKYSFKFLEKNWHIKNILEINSLFLEVSVKLTWTTPLRAEQ